MRTVSLRRSGLHITAEMYAVPSRAETCGGRLEEVDALHQVLGSLAP